jgi:riboflavin biosynthesis pyrimidine reductase
MTGFVPDLGVHYAAAAQIPAQARLIGSVTMATGLDAFGVPGAAASPDVGNRIDDATLPYWVVVDPTGRLLGRLHDVRAFPGVREVLVLLSGSTPPRYRDYLHEHGYPSHTSGDRHADLGAALCWLREEWAVCDVLVDSGPTLTSVVLEQDLVDETQLLVHPIVVGRHGRHVFGELTDPASLALSEQSSQDGVVRLRYHRAGSGGAQA